MAKKKENNNDLFNNLKIISTVIGTFFVIITALGFFIWNIYLFKLGFTEIELIQTKFILSGGAFVVLFLTLYLLYCLLNHITEKWYFFILFLILIIAAFLIFRNRVIGMGLSVVVEIFSIILLFFIFYLIHSELLKEISIKIKIFIYIMMIFILTYTYAIFIFPLIPSFLGGGQPRALAIISTKEEIKHLSNFGILSPEGGPTQTANLCIAYENNDIIILLLPDRLMHFRKDYTKGFVFVPTKEIKELRHMCSKYAKFLMSGKNYFD